MDVKFASLLSKLGQYVIQLISYLGDDIVGISDSNHDNCNVDQACARNHSSSCIILYLLTLKGKEQLRSV